MKENAADYCIIEGSTDEILSARVARRLNDGWVCQGGVCVVYTERKCPAKSVPHNQKHIYDTCGEDHVILDAQWQYFQAMINPTESKRP